MTEACSICGEFSRDACSFYYSGAALYREIKTCPMLNECRRGAILEHMELQHDLTGRYPDY